MRSCDHLAAAMALVKVSMIKSAEPAWLSMLRSKSLGADSVARLGSAMGMAQPEIEALSNKFVPGYRASLPTMKDLYAIGDGVSRRGSFLRDMVRSFAGVKDQRRMRMFRSMLRPADLTSQVGSYHADRINTLPLGQEDKLYLRDLLRNHVNTGDQFSDAGFLRRPVIQKWLERKGRSRGVMFLSNEPPLQELHNNTGGGNAEARGLYDDFPPKFRQALGSDPARPMIAYSDPATLRHEVGHWLNGRMAPTACENFLVSLASRMHQHDPTFLRRVSADDFTMSRGSEMMAQYLGSRPSGIGGPRLMNSVLAGGSPSPGVAAMPNDRLKSTMAHLEKHYGMPTD